jgi:hypothetical protein
MNDKSRRAGISLRLTGADGIWCWPICYNDAARCAGSKMKNYLIILITAGAFATAGFLIGATVAPQKIVHPEPSWSNDMTTEQKSEALRLGAEQIKIMVENKKQRGTTASAGALIAGAIGVLVGIGLTF